MAESKRSIFKVEGYIVIEHIDPEELVDIIDMEKDLLKKLEERHDGFLGSVTYDGNLEVEIKSKSKKKK